MNLMKDVCRRCNHGSADLKLNGCGCLLHVACTPLSLICSFASLSGGIPAPVTQCLDCPVCRRGTVTGIELFPLSFSDLERAIELRSKSGDETNKKRPRDDAFHQIQVESSFLLLNHTRARSDHHNHRTGRWSNEEVAFVDALVAAFDSGTVPLPYGIKLNEFLGDMLMCKSSRLTKKMKNAKLSTRSYTFGSSNQKAAHICFNPASLQEHFLHSIASEPMRLELCFNMAKLWRTHFSNLCLQVGYELLDARHWLSSLEDMEARATHAEDYVRMARRRRLGSALSNDVGSSAPTGVFIGGRPANQTLPSQVVAKPNGSTRVQSLVDPTTSFVVSDASENTDIDEMDMLANVLGAALRPRAGSMDWDDFDDCSLGDQLAEAIPSINDTPETLGDCGPFLDQIIQYMEKEQGPFEHVDIWVPSFVDRDGGGPSQSGDTTRLYHAGHATRADINSTLAFQLHEYGIYSTNFSFAPGVGLPGRVFNSGKPSWEMKVNETDSVIFERAGGAKIYGVKTALGIPLHSAAIGRMVVALYSTKEIAFDQEMVDMYTADFARWTPEPKWQLVIDLGNDSNHSKASSGESGVAIQEFLMDAPRLPPMLTQPPDPVPFPTPTPNWQSVRTPPLDPQPAPLTSSWHSQNQLSTSPRSADIEVEVDEEKIASLLGQHMPLTGQQSPGGSEPSLLPHYISLRLLLLRSADRRTNQEQDLLNILIKSFRGYSKDNRRSGADLAALLAKDWMFLASAYLPVTPSPTPSMPIQKSIDQHQCHVLSAPSLTNTGAGMTFAPPAFGNSFSSMNSLDGNMVHYYHHNNDACRVAEDDRLPANIVEAEL